VVAQRLRCARRNLKDALQFGCATDSLKDFAGEREGGESEARPLVADLALTFWKTDGYIN
ncbi:MAG: hypothetical protein ACK2UP_02765, partial [Candidatus Promineifilaceae bacterium]